LAVLLLPDRRTSAGIGGNLARWLLSSFTLAHNRRLGFVGVAPALHTQHRAQSQ
jgi:hypothetical protein